MTNPAQPGQENYGQGASSSGESGAASPWSENPAGTAGPGAYVAPAHQPGVAYPTAYTPQPPDPSAVAYPTAYAPQPSDPSPGAYPTAYIPPPDPSAVAYPTAYYPPPAGAGYPQPGYGYGAPYSYFGQYPQARATDGMAIASLVVSCAAVLSLCAWGIFGLLLGTLGAIFGHVAKRRIRDSGASGDGLALAGIIVGWISAVLGLIGVGLLVALIVLDETSTSY